MRRQWISSLSCSKVSEPPFRSNQNYSSYLSPSRPTSHSWAPLWIPDGSKQELFVCFWSGLGFWGLALTTAVKEMATPQVSEAVWSILCTGCERGGRDLVQRFSSQQVGW